MTDETAKITATLKDGRDFDSSWVVVRADSAAELRAQLATLDAETLGAVRGAAQRFQGSAPSGAATQAVQTLANAGVVAQGSTTEAYAQDAASGGPGAFNDPSLNAAPPWQNSQSGAKACKHGEMKFKNGVTRSGPRAGQPYKGYFCPAPYGAPDQCKPEFVN